MNIEQIAQEVAVEIDPLQRKLQGYFQFSEKQLSEFLRRCLNKLAEQEVEPVAFAFKHSLLGVLYDFSETEHSNGMVRLYTEAQLMAAQQRTAEACAKAVERLIGGDGLCADDGVWIHDCAEAIRNGHWREYL